MSEGEEGRVVSGLWFYEGGRVLIFREIEGTQKDCGGEKAFVLIENG